MVSWFYQFRLLEVENCSNVVVIAISFLYLLESCCPVLRLNLITTLCRYMVKIETEMLANNYGTIKWEWHTLHLKNKEENKKKIKQIYFIE